MQNSKPVAYFLLVDFGEGLGSRGYPRVPAVLRVTGGKQSQLLVLGLRMEFDNFLHLEHFVILSPYFADQSI